MPRTRPPYPAEFRAEAVELLRSGAKSIRGLSRDLGVSDQTLRHGLRQGDIDAGRRQGGLTTTEREEVRRLWAENRTLRMDRDLLKKRRSSSPATAIGVGNVTEVFRFIDADKTSFPIAFMCRRLGVSTCPRRATTPG